jgi:hypothetical protein
VKPIPNDDIARAYAAFDNMFGRARLEQTDQWQAQLYGILTYWMYRARESFDSIEQVMTVFQGAAIETGLQAEVEAKFRETMRAAPSPPSAN